MRYLIVSDIHGSVSGANRTKDLVKRENPDVLIILGDILHGARDEDDLHVASILLSLPCGLLLVKGNCDYSSDENILKTSLPTSRRLDFGLHSVYLMHRPPYASFPINDLVMHGHTHVKRLEKVEGVYYFNPGSISLPRDDGPGYGLFDGKRISLYDALTYELIASEALNY